MNTLSLPQAAMQIATIAHKNQKRKYTNDPYIIHPGEVAGILSTFLLGDNHLEFMLAMAWLHDVIEDCGYTEQSLHKELMMLTNEHYACGFVSYGVFLLSDLDEGNRATRKVATVTRLSKGNPSAQSVKCADILSNLKSIATHDKKFAFTFIDEALVLVNSLTGANKSLREYTLTSLKETLQELRDQAELEKLNAALMKNKRELT